MSVLIEALKAAEARRAADGAVPLALVPAGSDEPEAPANAETGAAPVGAAAQASAQAAPARRRLRAVLVAAAAAAGVAVAALFWLDGRGPDRVSLNAAPAVPDDGATATAGKTPPEPAAIVAAPTQAVGAPPPAAAAPAPDTAAPARAPGASARRRDPAASAASRTPRAAAPQRDTGAAAAPAHIPPATPLIRARPDASAESAAKARAAASAGDWSAAEAHWRQVLANDVDDIDGWIGLAYAARARGDAAAAAAALRRALRIDPNDAQALAAAVQFSEASPAERESLARAALSRAPDSAPLWNTLGAALAAQGRWAEAQQAYFNAASHDPQRAAYALNVAVALDRMRQRAAAVQWYRRALALAAPGDGFQTAGVEQRLQALDADQTR